MKKLQGIIFQFLKTHCAEIVCFCLFIILLFVGWWIHELWYDELHAWLVAKDAPWGEILFFLPHFEGHPPFYHILLAVPAKLGIGWQWGMRWVNLCSIAAAYLLIFKSPFPRWVRVTLPFSFFLFYQYSVIARPYSIFMLILFLLAYYFPQKDERPYLFTSLLGALCACHLLGITIAGGIAIAWLWEIKAHQPWKQFLHALLKDKRFHALLWLLTGTLVLCALIFPTISVGQFTIYAKCSPLKRLFYLWFMAPADMVITNLLHVGYLAQLQTTFWEACNALVITSVIWILLWKGLRRTYGLYLVLPYILSSFVMIFYCYRHHLGILLLLFIWYCWISLQSNPLPANYHTPRFKKIVRLFLILALFISVSWTVCDFIWDIKYPITAGKKFADFIKKHDLIDKYILINWRSTTVETKDGNKKIESFVNLAFSQPINFGMEKNIFANFDPPVNTTYYVPFHIDKAMIPFYMQHWRLRGKPDMLVGEVPLHEIFPQEESPIWDYELVYQIVEYHLWKFDPPSTGIANIYVRKDLLQKHHLTPIKGLPTMD